MYVCVSSGCVCVMKVCVFGVCIIKVCIKNQHRSLIRKKNFNFDKRTTQNTQRTVSKFCPFQIW